MVAAPLNLSNGRSLQPPFGVSSCDRHASRDLLPDVLVACTACHVLASQVDKALAETDELREQAHATQMAALQAEEAQQTTVSMTAKVREENAALEDQCKTAQNKLEEHKGLDANTWDRWRDEITAWRTLRTDAQATVDTLSSKSDDLEHRKNDLELATLELEPLLETTRAEVERLHAVQSDMEAQRLQEMENAMKEVHMYQEMEAKARMQATAAHAETVDAEEQLMKQSLESTSQQSRLKQVCESHTALEREVAKLRPLLSQIRGQCFEERSRCSDAVNLLHVTEKTPVLSDRACSPIHETCLAALAQELEACRQETQRLEDDCDILRNQRRSDSERCRDSIDKLRSKVHKYRARCDELRYLTPAAECSTTGPASRVLHPLSSPHHKGSIPVSYPDHGGVR